MNIPHAFRIGTRPVLFTKATMADLSAYAQEQCLTDLMRGRPFGDIIADAVRLGYLSGKKQPDPEEFERKSKTNEPDRTSRRIR
jgi:hypothetical protein